MGNELGAKEGQGAVEGSGDDRTAQMRVAPSRPATGNRIASLNEQVHATTQREPLGRNASRPSDVSVQASSSREQRAILEAVRRLTPKGTSAASR